MLLAISTVGFMLEDRAPTIPCKAVPVAPPDQPVLREPDSRPVPNETSPGAKVRAGLVGAGIAGGLVLGGLKATGRRLLTRRPAA